MNPNKPVANHSSMNSIYQTSEKSTEFRNEYNSDSKTKDLSTLPRVVYLLTFVAQLGVLSGGYDMGITSGAILVLQNQMKLSLIWQQLIIATPISAAMLTTCLGSHVCDEFGRKKTIIIASLFIISGAVINSSAFNKPMLLIGRFLIGCGLGECLCFLLSCLDFHEMYPDLFPVSLPCDLQYKSV